MACLQLRIGSRRQITLRSGRRSDDTDVFHTNSRTSAGFPGPLPGGGVVVVGGKLVSATVEHAKPRCLLSFHLTLQCLFCGFQLGKGELDT
jgi:hypothetical protein